MRGESGKLSCRCHKAPNHVPQRHYPYGTKRAELVECIVFALDGSRLYTMRKPWGSTPHAKVLRLATRRPWPLTYRRQSCQTAAILNHSTSIYKQYIKFGTAWRPSRAGPPEWPVVTLIGLYSSSWYVYIPWRKLRIILAQGSGVTYVPLRLGSLCSVIVSNKLRRVLYERELR